MIGKIPICFEVKKDSLEQICTALEDKEPILTFDKNHKCLMCSGGTELNDEFRVQIPAKWCPPAVSLETAEVRPFGHFHKFVEAFNFVSILGARGSETEGPYDGVQFVERTAYGVGNRGISRIEMAAIVPKTIRFYRHDLKNIRACLRRLREPVGLQLNSNQMLVSSETMSCSIVLAPKWQKDPARLFRKEAHETIRVPTKALLDKLALICDKRLFEEIFLKIERIEGGCRLWIDGIGNSPKRKFQGSIRVLEFSCDDKHQNTESSVSTVTFSTKDLHDLLRWDRAECVELGFCDSCLIVQHDQTSGGGRSILMGRSTA
jgi:hypothetical protein